MNNEISVIPMINRGKEQRNATHIYYFSYELHRP